MKKFIFILLLTILFIPNAYAMDLSYSLTTDTCSQDVFNYYCEVKNDTAFSQVFNLNRDNMGDYFEQYVNIPNSYLSTALIYKVNDYMATNDVLASWGLIDYDYSSSYMVILVSNSYYSANKYLSLGDNLFGYFNSILIGNVFDNVNILFFDNDFNYLNSFIPSSVGNDFAIYPMSFDITSHSQYFSSFIYSDFMIKTPFELRIKSLVFDNETVYLSSNYNWFERTWENIFGGTDIELKNYTKSTFGIDYFNTNYLSHPDTLNLVTIQESLSNVVGNITLPSGLTTVSNVVYDTRFWLIPKSLTCAGVDTYVFGNSTINNTNIFFNYHLLNGDTVDIQKTVGQTSLNIWYSNVNYFTNFIKAGTVDFKVTDYILSFRAKSNFANHNFYYNANCYDVIPFSENDLVFTNVNTSNTITIDSDTQKFLFDSQIKNNKPLDESGSSGTFTGGSDLTETGLVKSGNDLFGNIKNSLTKFSTSLYAIGSLFTSMFLFLPIEFQSFLYFSFVVGGLILILKIIF